MVLPRTAALVIETPRNLKQTICIGAQNRKMHASLFQGPTRALVLMTCRVCSGWTDIEVLES
jgi:hypothetical protein